MASEIVSEWSEGRPKESDLVILLDNSFYEDRTFGIHHTAQLIDSLQEDFGMNLSPSEFPMSEEQLEIELLERTNYGKDNANEMFESIISTYTNQVCIQEMYFKGEKLLEFGDWIRCHYCPETYKTILTEILSKYQGVELKTINSSSATGNDFFYGKFSPKDHPAKDHIMICHADFPAEYWEQIVPHPKNGMQEIKDTGVKLKGEILHAFFKADGTSYVQPRLFNDTWNVLENKIRSYAKEFNDAGIPTRVLYLKPENFSEPDDLKEIKL